MFGSENVQSRIIVIDADPGGDGEAFYAFRAPRDLTVKAGYMVAEQAQNAGTAVVLTLQNWGTAGTAIKSSGGTVVASLGGTATAARLSARTPAAGTVNTDGDNILQGEWLVLLYGELGTGWIASDRFQYQFDFVNGVG